MHKSCMKMPNDVEKYYNVRTYTITDVQSQKFNSEVAGQFLRDTSERNSRYYIRLLYQNGRYTHTEQAYKISLIEFIANIGGISGFCVGMSIMSLFQIFLYLLMAKVGHLQRRKGGRKRNSKQDYRNNENQDNVESSSMIKEEPRSPA
uniref:Uncharacterized protein n=1 Tax=Acrobeloides nanus TaxID=290746 RepID=A0A914C5M7_9BILA